MIRESPKSIRKSQAATLALLALASIIPGTSIPVMPHFERCQSEPETEPTKYDLERIEKARLKRERKSKMKL